MNPIAHMVSQTKDLPLPPLWPPSTKSKRTYSYMVHGERIVALRERGLNDAQIAIKLDMAPSTVRSHAYRYMSAMRGQS